MDATLIAKLLDTLTTRDLTLPVNANSVVGICWHDAGKQWVIANISINGTTMLTSPDGFTWTQRTVTSGDYYDIAAGNGIIVAVQASSANYVTSTDGITWTTRALPRVPCTRCLVFENGLFFLFLKSTSGAFYTSPDGIHWTLRSITAGLGTIAGVKWAKGTWVIVAHDGTTAYPFTSSDAITWTARTTVALAGTVSALGWVAGLFVYVPSNGGTVTNPYMTSPDGVTWSARTMPALSSAAESANLNLGAKGQVLTMNGATLAVIPNSMTTGSWFTTADGIDWTRRTNRANAQGTWTYIDAEFNGAQFIELSQVGPNSIGLTEIVV